MQNPCGRHGKGVRRVFQYLNHHRNLGIHYYRTPTFEPVCYVDADFARNTDEYKSTTGYLFLLAGSVIEYKSQKQKMTAQSTTEAEYIAGSAAAQEAVWIHRFLAEIGVPTGPIAFKYDSNSAIAWTKNPVQHHRTKHIGIKYHYIQQAYMDGEIAISYVPTDENIADGLTKPLVGRQFVRFVQGLGLRRIARRAED
jgi:hypothetical protein